MATRNPVRVELGKQLRELRERAGLSTNAVEEYLRWYTGKASKVETGTRVPTFAEMDRLADFMRVTPAERADLHALADAARKRTPMPRVADFAQTYVLLEQGAESIDYHDAELIPALLQAPGYARDLLAQMSTDDIDERLASRLARRGLLDGPNAPTLRVVLSEAALCRLPADASAAREQLDHLLAVCELPNVDVRFLPFAAGLHSAVGVGFTVLRLSSPAITRVYLEGATAATYLHEPDETDVYERAFDRLWSGAASADESATILRRRIQQVTGNGGSNGNPHMEPAKGEQLLGRG